MISWNKLYILPVLIFACFTHVGHSIHIIDCYLPKNSVYIFHITNSHPYTDVAVSYVSKIKLYLDFLFRFCEALSSRSILIYTVYHDMALKKSWLDYKMTSVSPVPSTSRMKLGNKGDVKDHYIIREHFSRRCRSYFFLHTWRTIFSFFQAV